MLNREIPFQDVFAFAELQLWDAKPYCQILWRVFTISGIQPVADHTPGKYCRFLSEILDKWNLDYQSFPFDFTKAFPFIPTDLADASPLVALRTVSTGLRRIAAFHTNEWYLVIFFIHRGCTSSHTAVWIIVSGNFSVVIAIVNLSVLDCIEAFSAYITGVHEYGIVGFCVRHRLHTRSSLIHSCFTFGVKVAQHETFCVI